MKSTAHSLLLAAAILALFLGFRTLRGGNPEVVVKRALSCQSSGPYGNYWLGPAEAKTIQSLGTNAVPVLLSELKRVRGHAKLDRFMRQRWVPQIVKRRYLPYWEYRSHIVSAFERLGLTASNAVPELVRLLYDPDGETAMSAGDALHAIGKGAKPAVEQIVLAANSTNPWTRLYARKALLTIDPETSGKYPPQ